MTFLVIAPYINPTKKNYICNNTSGKSDIYYPISKETEAIVDILYIPVLFFLLSIIF